MSAAGAAHADPAWCGDASQMEQGFADDFKPGKPVEQRLLAAAYMKCHAREVDDMHVVDAGIQGVNKELGMTDADWADAADYARSHGEKTVRQTGPDKAAWTTRDPIEQYATFQYPVLSAPGISGEIDKWDLADIFGPKLSQAGRIALVQYCLRQTAVPAEWIMCQGDIDALDFTQLDAEIRADKTHPGAAHIAVRLAAHDLKAQLKEHAEAVAKLKATDPTWGKLFDLAAQETKDWNTRYKEKPDLIAVAAEMDDAFSSASRKASEGCHDKTWDQLAKAVRALPAKSFITHRQKDEEEVLYGNDVVESTISTIIGDPEGFLAANAFMMCHLAARTNDIVAANLAPRISRWSGFRGPRTGAMTRLILSPLQFDDQSYRMDLPQLRRFWIPDDRIEGQMMGIVASVKVKGDKATVSYEKKKSAETYDYGCSQGRLHGIRSDGSLEYELNCKGSKTVMVDHAVEPDDIDARYSKNLKPGMETVIRKGALYLAWPKAGATTPVLVLGQPVK